MSLLQGDLCADDLERFTTTRLELEARRKDRLINDATVKCGEALAAGDEIAAKVWRDTLSRHRVDFVVIVRVLQSREIATRALAEAAVSAAGGVR